MRQVMIVLLGILSLASTGISAPAAEAPSTDDAVTRVELRPFATTTKKEYALGEPVFLQVVLANASKEDQFEVSANWHPANDFDIEIARAGGLPRRFTAGVKGELRLAATYKIRPETLIAQRWTICVDPDHPTGFFFDQPGVYTIRCRVRIAVNNYPTDLNLGSHTIKVLEPTPEQEEIVKLIMRPECAWDLQKGRASDETAPIWKKVATEYPDSVWGPFADLLLAWHRWDSGADDYEKVADQFQSLIEKHPNFVLLDTIYYGVAASYDRAGDNLKALDWLNRLQLRFPMSRHIREGDPLFQRYIYRKEWESRYAPWYLKE